MKTKSTSVNYVAATTIKRVQYIIYQAVWSVTTAMTGWMCCSPGDLAFQRNWLCAFVKREMWHRCRITINVLMSECIALCHRDVDIYCYLKRLFLANRYVSNWTITCIIYERCFILFWLAFEHMGYIYICICLCKSEFFYNIGLLYVQLTWCISLIYVRKSIWGVYEIMCFVWYSFSVSLYGFYSIAAMNFHKMINFEENTVISLFYSVAYPSWSLCIYYFSDISSNLVALVYLFNATLHGNWVRERGRVCTFGTTAAAQT